MSEPQEASGKRIRFGRIRFGRIRFGPGLIVTAAFIGPGTVITASKAGSQSGCQLLWTIALATIGTIVLQLSAARLGILTGSGLSEAMNRALAGSWWKRPAIGLVLLAIGLGNAAYQTGNLTGAAMGVSSVAGGSLEVWVGCLAVVTLIVILCGKDVLLQRLLVGMVVLLSVCFIVTALFCLPPWQQLVTGLMWPSFDSSQWLLVLGLIGTTIVPYNLFLHASRSAAVWDGVPLQQALRESRWDTTIAITIGGLVTASIMLTANAAFFETGRGWSTPSDLARQLGPSLGEYSGLAFGAGLFCAGLTSSITAPLASAYAICGCLGWEAKPSSMRFRLVAIAIVVVGTAVALMSGKSPASTILIAQVSNGAILPIIAGFLMWVVQRETAKHSVKLSKATIGAGWTVVVAVAALGTWRVWSALS